MKIRAKISPLKNDVIIIAIQKYCSNVARTKRVFTVNPTRIA